MTILEQFAEIEAWLSLVIILSIKTLFHGIKNARLDQIIDLLLIGTGHKLLENF